MEVDAEYRDFAVWFTASYYEVVVDVAKVLSTPLNSTFSSYR